jgi:DNA-binding NtrC family response regulator
LIVEDNDALRRVVGKQVAELGYRQIGVPNAAAALDVLARTAISVVFSDIVMPGPLDGIALAREIAVRWPNVPVVLTSGFAKLNRTSIDPAIDGVKILTKPYGKRALAEALHAALDKSGAEPISPPPTAAEPSEPRYPA